MKNNLVKKIKKLDIPTFTESTLLSGKLKILKKRGYKGKSIDDKEPNPYRTNSDKINRIYGAIE